MADKALMKQIAEQKLKAFSIGTMGKRQMSKKEMEEQRKKEQEEAAAQAFEEFVATFQETPSKAGKVWVKAGTYDAGRRQEDTREKGKLYKPQSRLSELADKLTTAERAQEYARLLGDRKPDRPGKKRDREKKKSNLELFKEELKLIQEEREERHKYKGAVKSTLEDGVPAVKTSEESKYGSYDNGDPTTTNLYLGNLNPKITEQQLMEVFGRYGPLASIKIMWPRSDEEKARGRNCGFVAFMNRKDGERALKYLNGKDVMAYEMKLGWGKAVPIPPHPIYIPPAMLELTMPPPPSGLPFNAQPNKRDKHKVQNMRPNDPYPTESKEKDELDKILSQAVVKVVIPTERNLLMLIHRMIEFVIREGPMFEAMIMNREMNNPMFRFLFENQSPAHVYYRWKLFSLLQGDLQLRWHTQEFRMFKAGSIWKPPPMNPYTQGMPDELVEGEEKEPRKGSLSNTQRDRLEDLLRNMTPERLKVAEAMVFCIEHSEAADEICDCIAESLSILQTPIPKKIARLYLISDILHNCGVKITNASFYRKGLESRLLHIFQDVHAAYMSLESRLKAEGFKLRVMQMFRAWEEWAVYPKDFLIKLQNTFLGLTSMSDGKSHQESEGEEETEVRVESELDGMPMSGGEGEGEDLDGVPLDGAALLKGAMKHSRPLPPPDDDLDGVPMDDDIDGEPLPEDVAGDNANSGSNKGKSGSMPAGFVPSRWETVDPEQVEAQAMTTSKWDLLEHSEQPEQADRGEDPDSAGGEDSQEGDYQSYEARDLNEDRRARLREIELKAVQYQDELECGQRTLKSGWSIQQQVEHYRRKLLRKAEKGEREKENEPERDRERQQGSGSSLDRRRRGDRESSRSERSSRRSSSPDDSYYHRADRDSSSSRSKSKRSRSSSGSPVASKRSYRSRSRSPVSSRKSSRRSRSPHSKKSRGQSPLSPSRLKHRGPSPPSPPRIKHRGSSPSSPPRMKRRGGSPPTPQRLKRRGSSSPSSPRSKHRGSSPASPPRKHKHKHKY
ncbi:U2 snRNP-associated SURP motif-containing protein [Zootermopsis nevadensis]|uniref:U2 snRNP-associated SURP motif-containing protein n=1 Tax=Zootermopsis nevadensis TaxID=136037 RepID=UPI000B8E5528|nr:U2 snRNP-associated SURP motif-containing protein [Zootermopsis nevadensis]